MAILIWCGIEIHWRQPSFHGKMSVNFHSNVVLSWVFLGISKSARSTVQMKLFIPEDNIPPLQRVQVFLQCIVVVNIYPWVVSTPHLLNLQVPNKHINTRLHPEGWVCQKNDMNKFWKQIINRLLIWHKGTHGMWLLFGREIYYRSLSNKGQVLSHKYYPNEMYQKVGS